MVDGAGHDVPGRQFATRIEARHETLAIGQAEQGAFAAQCLGDEETLGLRVVQAGRMELVEFRLPTRQPARQAMAIRRRSCRRDCWYKVDLARAAGH